MSFVRRQKHWNNTSSFVQDVMCLDIVLLHAKRNIGQMDINSVVSKARVGNIRREIKNGVRVVFHFICWHWKHKMEIKNGYSVFSKEHRVDIEILNLWNTMCGLAAFVNHMWKNRF